MSFFLLLFWLFFPRHCGSRRERQNFISTEVLNSLCSLLVLNLHIAFNSKPTSSSRPRCSFSSISPSPFSSSSSFPSASSSACFTPSIPCTGFDISRVFLPSLILLRAITDIVVWLIQQADCSHKHSTGEEHVSALSGRQTYTGATLVVDRLAFEKNANCLYRSSSSGSSRANSSSSCSVGDGNAKGEGEIMTSYWCYAASHGRQIYIGATLAMMGRRPILVLRLRR
eukprot:GHVT01097767.1.p1 GENE.GHVT01097767.1~~GHVT01097767.1.p1  ORF type:complete len:227 (+),score=30.89 GHVT01097767.1:484-1164(+)